jgi:hypothetical protein
LPCPLHQRTRILARFRTVNVGHRDLEAARHQLALDAKNSLGKDLIGGNATK